MELCEKISTLVEECLNQDQEWWVQKSIIVAGRKASDGLARGDEAKRHHNIWA